MSAKQVANELERKWSAANPRAHWTSDFWAACRPEHDEEDASE